MLVGPCLHHRHGHMLKHATEEFHKAKLQPSAARIALRSEGQRPIQPLQEGAGAPTLALNPLRAQVSPPAASPCTCQAQCKKQGTGKIGERRGTPKLMTFLLMVFLFEKAHRKLQVCL